MNVLDHVYNHPMPLEERAVASLAGGIASRGYQCGIIWGTALAAGAEVYRKWGNGFEAETRAIMAGQRVIDAFRTGAKNEIDCREVTGLDFRQKTQPLKVARYVLSGARRCFLLVSGVPRKTYQYLERELSDTAIIPSSLPVSCTAQFARQAGVSEEYVMITAGLAGGVGLRGGGCGVLGAAAWLSGIKLAREQVNAMKIMSSMDPLIERFLEKSQSSFECSEIAGRRFESITDHAEYLKNGGCAEIISSLAEYVSGESG